MCAINPAHKKRLILDVYTSDSKTSKEKFAELVLQRAIHAELKLNGDGRLRWHLKESYKQAD